MLRPSLSVAVSFDPRFDWSKREIFSFYRPYPSLQVSPDMISQYNHFSTAFFVSIEMIGCFYRRSGRNLYDE